MWILPKSLTSRYVPGMAESTSDLDAASRCAQSLMRRSKPSQSSAYLREWKAGNLMRLRSGLIYDHSLGQSFLERWISYLAATRVNLSAQQESDSGQKTNDTCGHTLLKASLFSSQEFAYLRTSKDILRWDSPLLSAIWKKWVTKCRGEYSARLNAARHTSASESLSWPSPVASEVRQGFQDRSRGMKGSQESLTTVVLKHGPPAPDSHSTHGSRLESWATPTARDHKSGRGKEDRDYKELTPMVERTQAGKLNPRWVETLMGLPIGWTMPSCTSPVTIAQTSCASLETALSQPQQH